MSCPWKVITSSQSIGWKSASFALLKVIVVGDVREFWLGSRVIGLCQAHQRMRGRYFYGGMLGNYAIFKFFTYIDVQEKSICWDGGTFWLSWQDDSELGEGDLDQQEWSQTPTKAVKIECCCDSPPTWCSWGLLLIKQLRHISIRQSECYAGKWRLLWRSGRHHLGSYGSEL